MNTENLHFFLANSWQNAKHKMSLGDASLKVIISLMASNQVLTAHYLFKLDLMTMTKGVTLHNLNLICWKTSNFYKLAVNK